MKRATAIGFAQALSGAATVDEVDSVIRTGLAPLVDASGAILGTVDHDSHVLRLKLTGVLDPDIARRYEVLPLNAAGPFSEVLEKRSTLVIKGYDDWRAHASDDVVRDAMAAGLVTMVCAPLLDAAGEVAGTLAVAWSTEVEIDAPTYAIVQTAAELCQQTLERARATDQATMRATQLARLAELLADAMTVDETLQTVASHGQAPVGATATSIGLIDERAGILRTHHGLGVSDAVRDRYLDPPLDAPLAFTEAARCDTMVLLCDHSEYLARYPQAADTVQTLGKGARAALPIRSAGGRVLGSVIHAWAGPRTFDDTLLSALTTIAEMAGQAIERAQLIEQIQREAARHEALADLAELLASARTSADIAEVVVGSARAVVGATTANLAIVDSDDSLTIHHSPDILDEMRHRYATVPRDADIPHAVAVRDGAAIILETLDEVASAYPHLLDDFKAAGREAAAVMPLPDGTGGYIGAIGFSWDEPAILDPAARAALVDVSFLCAQALARARLSDAEHHLVTTLQDSVLTSLPPMRGLDIAARYLPAARHIGMGGDWYDGIVLSESRYAVIVGDVAGHGITAVGDMAQLKAVIGALVRLDIPLGEVYRQTTRLLRSSDRTITATALIVVIDVAESTLSYAAAGHPPPLLRDADGTTVELSGARQPLLGVFTEAVKTVATHPFPAGTSLVLYTDGLVERRREEIDRSITRLTDALRNTTATDADSMATQLLEENLSTTEPDDDVALVVINRET